MENENVVKLNEETLKQLQARAMALQSANTLVQMANREYQFFLAEQLSNLGLDSKDKFNVDFKTGVVSQVKHEPLVKATG